MSRHIRFLSAALAGALIASAIYTRTPVSLKSANKTGTTDRTEEILAGWENEYAEQNLYEKTPIPLSFSRAFSTHFTEARGKAEINFETGRMDVSVNGLDPLPEGSSYEVWLVENGTGPDNTAAIDEDDRILKLGKLPVTGSLVASVDTRKLAGFGVDMAAVMRVTSGSEPEFVIGGMQSIRYQVGREAILRQKREGSLLARLIPCAQAQGKNSQNLISQGQTLFTTGTFGGNGRTCATCHNVQNGFTIDRTIIAGLPSTDPLFVAETNPNLTQFDAGNPTKPAFENPPLMRSRGLILENINGFDLDSGGNLVHPPVFRMTPGLFNLSFTAPYGDSNCCADLQTFSAGAVKQHFTKTLNRTAGVDFIVPTATQLKALEAFQLSLSSPSSGSFSVSGRGSILSTKSDPLATDPTRPEVRGRNFFTTTNSCITCHGSVVFGGGVNNLDTGTEAFGQDNMITPTLDVGGAGTGVNNFQVPQLFGLRKTHFFHNGLAGNATTALSGHTLLFTNLRSAASFYTTSEFAASHEGKLTLADGVTLRFQGLIGMTSGQIDDVTAFLEAISKP